jgi:hypothetical protein
MSFPRALWPTSTQHERGGPPKWGRFFVSGIIHLVCAIAARRSLFRLEAKLVRAIPGADHLAAVAANVADLRAGHAHGRSHVSQTTVAIDDDRGIEVQFRVNVAHIIADTAGSRSRLSRRALSKYAQRGHDKHRADESVEGTGIERIARLHKVAPY